MSERGRGKTAEQRMEEYASEHYLLFGGEADDVISPDNCRDTLEYLGVLGFANGSLTQARKNESQAALYAGYRDPDAHYCDFCGRVLAGTEFDILRDGRERCPECSRTVVRKKKDFEHLFYQVKENMCLKFGIDLPTPVKIKVVSQAKIAKKQGTKYVPTKYFDARAIGLAINKRGKYTMLFENGAPRACLVATTAHELVHIWQYSHWNWPLMQAKYGGLFLAVCEGMAKWAEIQYLYLAGEVAIAQRFLQEEVNRDDVYGYGLKLFLNHYPLSTGIFLEGETPFQNVNEPIEI